MGSFLYAIAVIVGISSFILFVLSVALAESWLAPGVGTFYGQSDSAYSIYGVMASAVSVGLWQLSKDE